MTVAVGDSVPPELRTAEVRRRDGQKLELGALFRDRPAVLVFLRHFACVACSEHVTVLAPRLHEFTRLGLSVVYIGNGEANFIDGFMERNFVDPDKVTVVTDPSLAVFAAAGLHRSAMSSFGPRALFGVGRAMLHGFRQSTIEGDNYQQGGVLVLDAEGRVAYHHADRATGDHATLVDVIDAAMQVATVDAAVV